MDIVTEATLYLPITGTGYFEKGDSFRSHCYTNYFIKLAVRTLWDSQKQTAQNPIYTDKITDCIFFRKQEWNKRINVRTVKITSRSKEHRSSRAEITG